MLPPNFELYLFATLLMCLAPGPNVLLMISLGLRHGIAAALRGVAGVMTASLIFLTISALGVIAALAASPRLFAAIRYAGAAYLLYVGVRMFVTAVRMPLPTQPAANAPQAARPARSADAMGAYAAPSAPARTPSGHRGAFWQGFVTHLSNPKAVIFWSAILPPFVAMDRAVAPQIVLLGGAGIALDGLVLAAYGAFAGVARRAGSGPRLHRWLDGIAGVVFVGVGLWLLAAQ